MLNYTTHALEEFQAKGPNLLPDDMESWRFMCRTLHEGVKFELPMNGSLLEDMEKNYDVMEPELLRLPFPTMVLEYPFSIFNGDPTEKLHVPKRIALCLDYETHKGSLLARRAAMVMPALEDAGGILMLPLFFSSKLDMWYPSIWAVALPRVAPDGANLSQYFYGSGSKRRSSKIGFITVPFLQAAVEEQALRIGVEQAITDGLNDVGEEITSLVGLLAALSCSNVSLEDVAPPTALNKKRAGKVMADGQKKLPFYGYKVVIVGGSSPQGRKSRENVASGRNQPREHLRRGHIRHLSAGKNVWVNSTVVGSSSRGRIKQEYRLKA